MQTCDNDVYNGLVAPLCTCRAADILPLVLPCNARYSQSSLTNMVTRRKKTLPPSPSDDWVD